LIQDLVEETLCTTRRQIGENNDDGFVIHAVAIHALSVQELRLVSIDELDHVRHAASGHVFRSEPETARPKSTGAVTLRTPWGRSFVDWSAASASSTSRVAIAQWW